MPQIFFLQMPHLEGVKHFVRQSFSHSKRIFHKRLFSPVFLPIFQKKNPPTGKIGKGGHFSTHFFQALVSLGLFMKKRTGFFKRMSSYLLENIKARAKQGPFCSGILLPHSFFWLSWYHERKVPQLQLRWLWGTKQGEAENESKVSCKPGAMMVLKAQCNSFVLKGNHPLKNKTKTPPLAGCQVLLRTTDPTSVH